MSSVKGRKERFKPERRLGIDNFYTEKMRMRIQKSVLFGKKSKIQKFFKKALNLEQYCTDNINVRKKNEDSKKYTFLNPHSHFCGIKVVNFKPSFGFKTLFPVFGSARIAVHDRKNWSEASRRHAQHLLR